MHLAKAITFELCAETEAACLAALAGGAHRLELCSALEIGGLTPDRALVQTAVERSGLPVYALVRPSAETFIYSPKLMAGLASSLQQVIEGGVAGVVLGILQRDGRVDIEHTRELAECAYPLPVTFHRAFDATPDLERALEDVIAIGCTRVLTSGGAPDVLTGAPMLARLVQQAGDRIEILAGGGLTLENAGEVARLTGATAFHGSLRSASGPLRSASGPLPSASGPLGTSGPTNTPGSEQASWQERIFHMVYALSS